MSKRGGLASEDETWLMSRKALQRHLEGDLPAVMSTIIDAMAVDGLMGSTQRQGDNMQEAEAACKCAESWVGYGMSGE